MIDIVKARQMIAERRHYQASVKLERAEFEDWLRGKGWNTDKVWILLDDISETDIEIAMMSEQRPEIRERILACLL